MASQAIQHGYISILRGAGKHENHLLEDDEQEEGFLYFDQFTIIDLQRPKRVMVASKRAIGRHQKVFGVCICMVL